MADLVDSIEDIIHNVNTLVRYGEGDKAERKFHGGRIKNGKVFVAVRYGHSYVFSPSKFVGYKSNDIDHQFKLNERDGRITNVRIQSLLGAPMEPGSPGYDTINGAYLAYCREHQILPSQHHRARRYWLIDRA